MTTGVVSTTVVVNNGGCDNKGALNDSGSRLGYPEGVETLADRLEWFIEDRGISERELSRRSGLQEPHVGLIIKRIKKNPKATVEQPTLIALAKGMGASLEWLATGKGPRPPSLKEGEVEAVGPAPEPPSIELHEKPDTHWTTEEVEDWFLPVLQAAPPGRYIGRHVTAAKMCLRDRQMKLDRDTDMVALAAGVLEAAKALDEAHRPLTNATIFHYLATQNLPAFVPTKHSWKPGDKELIDKLKEEKGIEVNPDDPPEVRKERRRQRLGKG
jgi:hypothetical protein